MIQARIKMFQLCQNITFNIKIKCALLLIAVPYFWIHACLLLPSTYLVWGKEKTKAVVLLPSQSPQCYRCVVGIFSALLLFFLQYGIALYVLFYLPTILGSNWYGEEIIREQTTCCMAIAELFFRWHIKSKCNAT